MTSRKQLFMQQSSHSPKIIKFLALDQAEEQIFLKKNGRSRESNPRPHTIIKPVDCGGDPSPGKWNRTISKCFSETKSVFVAQLFWKLQLRNPGKDRYRPKIQLKIGKLVLTKSWNWFWIRCQKVGARSANPCTRKLKQNENIMKARSRAPGQR